MPRMCLRMATAAALLALVAGCDEAPEKTPEMSLQVSAYQVNNAAYWGGAVWFAGTAAKATESGEPSARSWLLRLQTGPDHEPERVADLPAVEPWFVAGTDRVWIVSEQAVAYYRGGQLHTAELDEPLTDVSRPFLYRGRPALIAAEPPGYRLRVWQDGAWQGRDKLRFKLPRESDACTGEYVEAFEWEGTLHVFCQVPLAAPVYYHRGLPRAEAAQTWQKVADAGGQWEGVCLGGRPALFYHTSRDGLAVVGRIRRDGGWEDFFTRGIGLDIGLGVCPTGEGEGFVLLRRLPPLEVRVLGVEDGRPAWAYTGSGTTNLLEALQK